MYRCVLNFLRKKSDITQKLPGFALYIVLFFIRLHAFKGNKLRITISNAAIIAYNDRKPIVIRIFIISFTSFPIRNALLQVGNAVFLVYNTPLYIYIIKLHTRNAALYVYNKKLHIRNMPLYVYNRALYTRNTSLYVYNKELHTRNTTLYIYNTALYVYNMVKQIRNKKISQQNTAP